MKPSRTLSHGVLGKGFVLFFMLLFMNYTPGKRSGKKTQKNTVFLEKEVVRKLPMHS